VANSQRQLFRSLAALFGVYVVCWLLSTLIKYNQKNFLPPNFVSNALSAVAGAIIAVAQTLNTPVLYATRSAPNKAYLFLICLA
jgi:hypothetical protein